MAEISEPLKLRCPQCHQGFEEGVLQTCVICRSLFCPACGVTGYGRQFCAVRCRDFFFYGDDDDEELKD